MLLTGEGQRLDGNGLDVLASGGGEERNVIYIERKGGY
jgi:hypothetical protein